MFRKIAKFGLLCLSISLFGVCLYDNSASAYYETGTVNGTDYACFAITWESLTAQASANSTTTTGNATTISGYQNNTGSSVTTNRTVLSTNKVCADLDSSGNIISGTLRAESGTAPDTTKVTYPKFEESNGSIVMVYTSEVDDQCATKWLTNCSDYEQTYTVNTTNFSQMAESFYNQVKSTPGTKSGNTTFTNLTLLELGDNETTEEYQVWADTADNTTNHSGDTYYEAATTSTSENSTSDDVDPCYSNAGVLGWIACPVFTALNSFVSGFYSELENNFLKVDSTLVSQSQSDDSTENGVFTAWKIFRDFANILFVILFLVVIFSQLTGVGITNYGIKKLLPKLIVVAILINLSYIICQLAVDVSNIIGASLKDLLSNLAGGTINVGESYSDSASAVKITVGLVVLTAGASFFVPSVFALLLPLIISIAIACIFLFVILVVREAGVVLAVVLSPLVLACYLLPNTEKLGKKWLDLFKGLLLLYPICSLVIGGGMFAGKVLASTNNTWMALAAMVVQVAPYFAIPSLLRGSLSGLGAIGTRLGNASSRLPGQASNTIRRSEGFRNARTRMNDIDPGGLRSRFARSAPGNFIGFNRTRSAQRSAATKLRNEDINAQAQLVSDRYAADASGVFNNDGTLNTDNQFNQDIFEAIQSGNIHRIQTTLKAGRSQYGHAATDALAQLAYDRNLGGANDEIGQRLATAMHQLANDEPGVSADMEQNADFRSFVNGGGRTNMQAVTHGGVLDSPEDVLRQSEQSMRRNAAYNGNALDTTVQHIIDNPDAARGVSGARMALIDPANRIGIHAQQQQDRQDRMADDIHTIANGMNPNP